MIFSYFISISYATTSSSSNPTHTLPSDTRKPCSIANLRENTLLFIFLLISFGEPNIGTPNLSLICSSNSDTPYGTNITFFSSSIFFLIATIRSSSSRTSSEILLFSSS